MKLARPHADIVLLCADLEIALRFWHDVFGFVVERSSATHATVRVGAQTLDLLAPHPSPPRHSGALYAGTGYRVLALLVDDLEGVCARLAAHGRRIASAPVLPGSWPIRFARDPDGNMLELIGVPEPARNEALERAQIGLTVADAARSRHFYGEILGLPEQPSLPMGDGMIRYAFSVGRTTLKFWSRGAPLPDLAGSPGAALGVRAIRLVVEDVDGTLSESGDRGASIAQEAGVDTGAHARWLQDPDRNWIELRGER